MSNFDYFYNYKSDFPNGNGWCGEDFYGEVIDSPSYRFMRGKYENKTLQDLMSRSWKGVLKYIDYGCIMITQYTFSCLRCKAENLRKLQVACDAKQEFEVIHSIHDKLRSWPFGSKYSGETLLYVAQKDPEYLSQLAYRSMLSYHGQYQSYYVSDRGLKFDNLDFIINEFEQQHINNKLLMELREYNNERKEREDELEEYAREKWEAEQDRMFREDAYREAYNCDPDAEWNTY